MDYGLADSLLPVIDLIRALFVRLMVSDTQAQLCPESTFFREGVFMSP